jgi:hypothetical protein
VGLRAGGARPPPHSNQEEKERGKRGEKGGKGARTRGEVICDPVLPAVARALAFMMATELRRLGGAWVNFLTNMSCGMEGLGKLLV